MRFAIVRNAEHEDRLEAFLPHNYTVVDSHDDVFVIAGEDHAGWTMDDYVIPRLASGLIWATEIETGDELQGTGGVTWAVLEGGLVRVAVISDHEVVVSGIDQAPMTVNRIPVTHVRIYFKLKDMDNPRLKKTTDGRAIQIYDVFTRRDGGNPATDSQRRKVLRSAEDLVSEIREWQFRGGRREQAFREIERHERRIQEAKESIQEHEEAIFQLRLEVLDRTGEVVA